MNTAALKLWLRQPSTIDGLGYALGTIVGLIAHVLTKETSVATAAGLSAKALVSIAVTDNTAAGASVQKLVSDAIQAAADKRMAAAMPALIGDVMAVVGTTGIAATVVAPVTAPVPPPQIPPGTLSAPVGAP